MQFDKKNCYKDIGSKAFFTMATLLMPLLGNGLLGIPVFELLKLFACNN